VIKNGLRLETTISKNHFGFVSRQSNMEATFLLRHQMKNIDKPVKISIWFLLT